MARWREKEEKEEEEEEEEEEKKGQLCEYPPQSVDDILPPTPGIITCVSNEALARTAEEEDEEEEEEEVYKRRKSERIKGLGR